MNSSGVGDSNSPDGTVTVPDLYFVPGRGYPTFFFPIFMDSAVYGASSVLFSSMPDGGYLAFGFSLTREFSWVNKFSVGTPVFSGSFLSGDFPSGWVFPTINFVVPIDVFGIMSLPTPFNPDDPWVYPFSVLDRALFATFYFLGCLREFYIYGVVSVFAVLPSVFRFLLGCGLARGGGSLVGVCSHVRWAVG